jgi:hypothetical protein
LKCSKKEGKKLVDGTKYLGLEIAFYGLVVKSQNLATIICIDIKE